ncbi:hypothetical protein MHZ93_06160 [Roseomonas sp. ACRSG]|nr:hypothetical protein [Roseomonas sp. ACRSG]
MATDGLSKSAFAQMMGVDRAQTTRWAQKGLPVREDGTIDPVIGAEWVRVNVASYARDRRSTGARQMRAASDTEAQRRHDDAMRCAVSVACHNMLSAAARAALDVNVPLPQAFALIRALQTRGAAAEAETLQTYLQVPPGERPLNEPMGAFWVDWKSIAREAGQPFDAAALEAYATKLVGPDPSAHRAEDGPN